MVIYHCLFDATTDSRFTYDLHCTGNYVSMSDCNTTKYICRMWLPLDNVNWIIVISANRYRIFVRELGDELDDRRSAIRRTVLIASQRYSITGTDWFECDDRRLEHFLSGPLFLIWVDKMNIYNNSNNIDPFIITRSIIGRYTILHA